LRGVVHVLRGFVCGRLRIVRRDILRRIVSVLRGVVRRDIWLRVVRRDILRRVVFWLRDVLRDVEILAGLFRLRRLVCRRHILWDVIVRHVYRLIRLPVLWRGVLRDVVTCAVNVAAKVSACISVAKVARLAVSVADVSAPNVAVSVADVRAPNVVACVAYVANVSANVSAYIAANVSTANVSATYIAAADVTAANIAATYIAAAAYVAALVHPAHLIPLPMNSQQEYQKAPACNRTLSA
jgi:hypothetical protein